MCTNNRAPAAYGWARVDLGVSGRSRPPGPQPAIARGCSWAWRIPAPSRIACAPRRRSNASRHYRWPLLSQVVGYERVCCCPMVGMHTRVCQGAAAGLATLRTTASASQHALRGADFCGSSASPPNAPCASARLSAMNVRFLQLGLRARRHCAGSHASNSSAGELGGIRWGRGPILRGPVAVTVPPQGPCTMSKALCPSRFAASLRTQKGRAGRLEAGVSASPDSAACRPLRANTKAPPSSGRAAWHGALVWGARCRRRATSPRAAPLVARAAQAGAPASPGARLRCCSECPSDGRGALRTWREWGVEGGSCRAAARLSSCGRGAALSPCHRTAGAPSPRQRGAGVRRPAPAAPELPVHVHGPVELGDEALVEHLLNRHLSEERGAAFARGKGGQRLRGATWL